MSKKATAKTGRLVWIEPNKLDEISDTGTFDYEDYSICVDLEVRIPKRSACGDETDVITFHTNHETAKDRISFFTGSDGYLTTSFTDITAADPTSNKETLGVSSIDISYNSYFYPQVTIKFIDVRGSSLMYPQEDMFKNGTQGSFFKALFCFPYPQFILKVKGFYGKQVQYDLAVEDFKTSFNPETGNFECIVQFIGYMYGIYTDLPMSYLIVAPYASFEDSMQNITISGKKYWDEQIANGVFVYDDNKKPLDKLVDLYFSLSRIESEITKKEQTNPYVIKKNDIATKLSHYETVENNYASWKRTIEKKYNFFYGEKYIHIYTNSNPSGEPIDDVTIASWGLLNSSIRDINSYDTTLPYIGEYSEILTEDLRKQIYGENNSNTPLFKEYNNLNDNIKKDLSPSNIVTEGCYFFSFEHFDFNKLILDTKTTLTTKINELNKKIESDRQTYLAETLGFTPNLKNIFKIVFAHIDTFMHIYYQVLDNIRNNKGNLNSNNPRGPLKLALNADNSDLIKGENFVPPYPLVVKTEDSKKEVMWPGNYTPAKDMIELKFVESLFNGIRSVESENRLQEKIDSSSTESSTVYIPTRNSVYNADTTSSLPIVMNGLSDFYFFNNPYTFFRKRDEINLYNIYSFLAYRLLDTKGLPDTYDAYKKGSIEAINFFKAVPLLREDAYNQQVFIQFLKNQKTNPNPNDFLKFLGLTKEHNDAEFLKKLGNESGTLFNSHASPFLNDKLQLPVNFNQLYGIDFTKKSETFFPTVPFSLTKTDFDKIGFFYDLWMRSKEDNLLKNDKSNIEYVQSIFQNNFLIDVASYSNRTDYNAAMINFIIKGSLKKHENKIYNNIGGTAIDSKEWDPKWIEHMYYSDSGKDSEIDYKLGEKIDYLHNLSALNDVNNVIRGVGIGCVIDPSYSNSSSIYGNILYYAQNNIKENNDKILAKAYLFLEACAPLANCNLYENMIGFYPEWSVLLCGARYWRSKKDKEPLTTQDTQLILESNKTPTMQVRKSYETPYSVITTSHTVGASFNSTKNRVEYRYLYGTINKGSDEKYYPLNYIKHDILVEEFKKWALTEFVIINNELELKGKNNDVFLPADIEGLSLIVKSFKSKSEQTISEIQTTINRVQCNTLKNLIGKVTATDKINLSNLLQQIIEKRVYDNYSFICNAEDGGLNLGLNYKRDISRQLFQKKIKNITVFSPISTKTTIKTKNIEESFKGFVNTLCQLYENNNGFENSINGSERVEDLATDTMLRNDDLKLSLYLTLKNLYDRWLCGCGKEKWDLNYYITDNNLSDASVVDERVTLCEYNKFFFIDSFYNDISSKICFNMHTFKELINSVIRDRIGDDGTMTNGMKFQGMSVYQFMASILQKNSMTFLAVPCFNTYKTEESIRELFTPYSWFDRGEPRGTSYVGIYPHQVSSHLNIEGANGYQYPNDGWDIADVNGDFKDTLEIGDLAIIDGGYVMPAFGVTYGKQDQSYFKKVTVNMDKPQVTEYSIGATLDIANHYGENQKVQTFVGQDLYKVYSNYSYTCTVEMMGNAMITPLMYFQLNNIPMFRGAYMVIKVEHSISQGNMTTIFTGVRMSKNKIPYVTPILEGEIVEDNLTDNGSNNNGIHSGNSNTTVIPGTPEEVGENVEKVLKYARAAIGIVEYGYDINKPQSQQTIYDKDTAPNGWIKDYVMYPTKEKDPDGAYKPIQGNSADTIQWCCVFVSWCTMRAGISPALSTGTGGWYKGENWDDKYNVQCDAVYNYYKKEDGRVIEMSDNNIISNPPQPGDFLLKKNTNTKDYPSKLFGHILMVESYNPETKTITVIHGNASQRVKREALYYDKVKDTYTHYCRPYYAGDIISNVPSTGSITPAPTIQPSADTNIQSSDTLILRTIDEKIDFIKAIISQESENKHIAVGDEKVTGGNAIGIMQIRPPMYKEINRIRNKYKKQNYILGQPFPGKNGTEEERKALTRDDQVKGFITVMEHINKIDNSYLSTGQNKTSTAIPWDFRKCCAEWNCGNGKKKCNDYVNRITTWYNKIKSNPSSFPSGDGNGWTPNAAFNSFFS